MVKAFSLCLKSVWKQWPKCFCFVKPQLRQDPGRMDAGTGSETVCENPHNNLSHDQAREVFHESKKLSSSSIPKDSRFFPFELLCHVVKWHLLQSKKCQNVVSECVHGVEVDWACFWGGEGEPLEELLEALRTGLDSRIRASFQEMRIRCIFDVFFSVVFKNVVRRFHIISPEHFFIVAILGASGPSRAWSKVAWFKLAARCAGELHSTLKPTTDIRAL